MRMIASTVIVLIAASPALADLMPEWQHSWGTADNDRFRGVALDSVGNAYVVGQTFGAGDGSSDALVQKYDPSGTLIWQRTWGGFGLDDGTCIAVGGDGFIYTGGYTPSFGGNGDGFVIKWDADGNIVWQRTYGTAGVGDRFLGIALDNHQAIYVCGGAPSTMSLVARFRTDGSILWAKTYNHAANIDEARSLDVDPLIGEFVVAGHGSGGGTTSIAYLQRYDSLGNLLWSNDVGDIGTFPIAADNGGGVILDADGIAFGGAFVTTTISRGIVIDFTSAGVVDWARTWSANDADAVSGIVRTSSGSIRGAGKTTVGGTNEQLIVLEFDGSGALTFERLWQGADDESANDIDFAASRTVIVGEAPSASGSWMGVSGSVEAVTPPVSTATGTLSTYPMTSTVVSGTLGTPTGIVDVGGGSADDALVLSLVESCACNCHADPAGCNGVQDVTDVVQIVNVAFRGNAPISDPNQSCPYERTDLNCTNSTDVLDVVKMVNVAFRNANATTEFCNPCP